MLEMWKILFIYLFFHAYFSLKSTDFLPVAPNAFPGMEQASIETNLITLFYFIFYSTMIRLRKLTQAVTIHVCFFIGSRPQLQLSCGLPGLRKKMGI